MAWVVTYYWRQMIDQCQVLALCSLFIVVSTPLNNPASSSQHLAIIEKQSENLHLPIYITLQEEVFYFSQLSTIMRQGSAFWVLFFIMVLNSHVVTCRFIRKANQTQPAPRFSESQHLSSSLSSFEDLSNKKVDITPAYTVSNKVVPGGPNPLHN